MKTTNLLAKLAVVVGAGLVLSSSVAQAQYNACLLYTSLGTNTSAKNIVAVNGCCYGQESVEDKGDYLKKCGQSFWSFISGDNEFYITIIEPLGHLSLIHI